MRTLKFLIATVFCSVFASAPTFCQTDLTSYVSTTDWGGKSDYTATEDGIVSREVFTWGRSLPTGPRMSQTLNLPNGKYRVELYAMASSTSNRDNTNNVITDGDKKYVSLRVGNQTQAIPAYNREQYTKNDSYTFPCVDVINGTLTITLTQDQLGPNWLTMQIKSLTCLGESLWGDVNLDKNVDVADVTETVDIILGKTEDQYHLANINRKEDVNVADVTELVDIILNKTTATEVKGRIFADQSAGYKSTDSNYDIDKELTTLNINTTGISNIASISVFSRDKIAISGDFSYNTGTGNFTYGNTPLTYTASANSDVITIMGTNNQATAHLLPVHLPNGITVTIRTTDGNFYSQDYQDIKIGEENTLTISQSSPSQLWMSTLPGTTYFSLLSTPGAHDAATNGVAKISADMARCQSENIDGLLANGVRAFDLRPAYKGSESDVSYDNLTIYHGIMSTGVKFKDAIETLADFVRKHPSEAVSILFQKESNTGTDRSNIMWESIQRIYEENQDVIYCGHPSNLTLADVRGKISIINRSERVLPTATNLQNWGDNRITTNYELTIGDECTAVVQDKYDTGTDDKKSVFSTMLATFANNTDPSRYCFNYTSIAYSVFNSIASKAKTMNPYAATQISNTFGPLGYLYADYIGSSSNSGKDLLNAIINQNYKYVYQGLGTK